jgi:hypothetical protein
VIWKGRELITIGDLMYHGIDACETPEEAAEFMRLYREDSPHADVNIGYLSGYYGHEAMQRIQQWFDVTHPIFGKTTPTPDAALEAGKRAALGEF